MKDKHLSLQTITNWPYYIGAMNGPFTQVAFFFHYYEKVKVWINHFEFDYENCLILGQTFDFHLNRLWKIVWSGFEKKELGVDQAFDLYWSLQKKLLVLIKDFDLKRLILGSQIIY